MAKCLFTLTTCPPLTGPIPWLQIIRNHKSLSPRVSWHGMEWTQINKTLICRYITKINSGIQFLRDKAILSAGSDDVFPVPSFTEHCRSEWRFPDTFQCSRIRRVAKTARQMGTTRQKKGHGFYKAGSQARLHMQPPIAVPVLLRFYQQRGSSQQWVCSKWWYCLILGISPGIEASSLEKGTEGKLWQYSNEAWRWAVIYGC